MAHGFQPVTHENLLAEQAETQSGTFHERTLLDYNSMLIPGYGRDTIYGSAVADLLRPLVPDDMPVSLENVLRGLCDARQGNPIHWADMGAGRAFAMRQLKTMPDLSSNVITTAVDLFDYGLDGLSADELSHLEQIAPGTTSGNAKPSILLGDVEKVALPTKADLITSAETIEYLYNPLEALANYYGQLADGGVMLVARDSEWASSIVYGPRNSQGQSKKPTRHLIEALALGGVAHAFTYQYDAPNGTRVDPGDPEYFRALAIRKEPGTLLKVNVPVIDIRYSRDNEKTVYYESPPNGSTAPIEVLHTA